MDGIDNAEAEVAQRESMAPKTPGPGFDSLPRHDTVLPRKRPRGVRRALYVFIVLALVLVCALLALYGGFAAAKGSGCQGDAFNATAAYGFNLWLNPGNWGSMGPRMITYCANWTQTHKIGLVLP